MAEPPSDPIKAALNECRPLFYGALLFSLVINLLGLAVPLYSMQVFDRVLSSGSVNTLAMLTLIVVVAVLFTGILTVVRAAGLTQLTRWLDDRLAQGVVEKTIALALHRRQL
jgi:ABC-type protease/lipase transport system fused ATPase/permease subunit